VFFFVLCRVKKNTLNSVSRLQYSTDEQEANCIISSDNKSSSLSLLPETDIFEGKIRSSLDEFSDYLPSGFLSILSYFAQHIGYFQPYKEHFHPSMKEVNYTILQKVQTIIASIAVGCSRIRDINHNLRPYKAAASLFGMEQFPDQSQINRFLERIFSQSERKERIPTYLISKE